MTRKKLPTTTESCQRCPYIIKLIDNYQYGCILNRMAGMMGGSPKMLENPAKIPDWCELENAEEEVKK